MTHLRIWRAALLLALAGCASHPPAHVVHRMGAEIGGYPNASSLNGTERGLFDQNGVTVNVTPAQLSTYSFATGGTSGLNLLLPSQVGQNGNCLATNGTNPLWSACGGGGGGGTPGGTNYQLQWNNAGAFGGIAAGTSGLPLVSGGTGAAPAFGTLSFSGLASLSANSILGNATGSTASAAALTGQQVQSLLIAANANVLCATVPAGPTNDYAPTNTCGAPTWGTTIGQLLLTPTSGGSTLNGLVAGSAMQYVILVNTEAAGGADIITLVNQSGSDGTAANRFLSAGNVAIPPGGSVVCVDVQTSVNAWSCH